jgi:DNA-binding FadR family transcriptional regulator
MFQKTNQQRIFQDLVDQIENAILDGRLQVGDKLPPQRKLVEMFQTSRGSLREAFRVLEQKGLIEVRLGVSGGAVVKAINTQPVTESLATLIQHKKVSLAELAEFREGVEGMVASLAAERVTADDMIYFKQILGEAEACVRKGPSMWEEFCAIDKKFHKAIAQACGNSVYQFVLRMVHDNIHQYYEEYPLRDAGIMQENYQDLCDIVRAMELGRATAVCSLVQSHVRRFNRYMTLSSDRLSPKTVNA